MSNRPKPLLLLILDGFGCRQETDYNAIANANTPCWDNLKASSPMTTLDCSGDVVGLPDQQMGNSEVGHLHIGAGRLLRQELSRVNQAILDGSFFENPVLCEAVDQAIKKDKALHIMGLLSPGGVHSHEGQIFAMLELAAKRGLKKIYLHAFLDGRDVPPKSAAESIERAEAKFSELGVGRISTLIGRFYVMDRDNRWERVEQAYKLLVRGETDYRYHSALDALQAAYDRDETDEFVSPSAILDENETIAVIEPDDSVVFMNFRADRAREISRALTEVDFKEFDRKAEPLRGYYATLTEYHQDFDFPVAFPPIDVKNSIGEVLSLKGMTQLRLAETEKYAHVTFFLNGGRDLAFDGEERILVPSPQVRTYDMQPEMSAPEVTRHLVDAIKGQKFDVIICNYANCDMVGHTGNYEAALKAVETIDQCLQQVTDALTEVGGQMLLTADHGNIEQMIDPVTRQPHTAHTTNKVPLVHFGGKGPLAENGNLADLAPSMLAILGIEQPVEMTGKSLVSL
ncbi:2,3-bisphosphoglycerate-independent phosphoglycerate mutase [methane-oxidizing endosymbiont of Gigantopelta aegis]|uniref:2,3-bisphosphoglycerate-independent phosphoglycerate mutase n=1 Tax=methane-oxidizing endosymbiont of Gigantopelta aegis TaxID=2794938 RepID=UPI0018DE11C7|nr:2,3-bisphosphoglycerate-independent phosphoglycerate mutase [methane-oxidizing endosymbiont of Gigantopelta aegis]